MKVTYCYCHCYCYMVEDLPEHPILRSGPREPTRLMGHQRQRRQDCHPTGTKIHEQVCVTFQPPWIAYLGLSITSYSSKWWVGPPCSVVLSRPSIRRSQPSVGNISTQGMQWMSTNVQRKLDTEGLPGPGSSQEEGTHALFVLFWSPRPTAMRLVSTDHSLAVLFGIQVRPWPKWHCPTDLNLGQL